MAKFPLEWTFGELFGEVERIGIWILFQYQSLPVSVFKSHNLDHQDWIYSAPNYYPSAKIFWTTEQAKHWPCSPVTRHSRLITPHPSLIFNSFDFSSGNCNSERLFHHFLILFACRRNPSVAEELGFRRSQQQSSPEERRRKPLRSKVQSLRKHTLHSDNIHAWIHNIHFLCPVTCDILVFSVTDCMNDGNVSRSVCRSSVNS